MKPVQEVEDQSRQDDEDNEVEHEGDFGLRILDFGLIQIRNRKSSIRNCFIRFSEQFFPACFHVLAAVDGVFDHFV